MRVTRLHFLWFLLKLFGKQGFSSETRRFQTKGPRNFRGPFPGCCGSFPASFYSAAAGPSCGFSQASIHCTSSFRRRTRWRGLPLRESSWFSPLNRHALAGTPRSVKAAKISFVCSTQQVWSSVECKNSVGVLQPERYGMADSFHKSSRSRGWNPAQGRRHS